MCMNRIDLAEGTKEIFKKSILIFSIETHTYLNPVFFVGKLLIFTRSHSFPLPSTPSCSLNINTTPFHFLPFSTTPFHSLPFSPTPSHFFSHYHKNFTKIISILSSPFHSLPVISTLFISSHYYIQLPTPSHFVPLLSDPHSTYTYQKNRALDVIKYLFKN